MLLVAWASRQAHTRFIAGPVDHWHRLSRQSDSRRAFAARGLFAMQRATHCAAGASCAASQFAARGSGPLPPDGLPDNYTFSRLPGRMAADCARRQSRPRERQTSLAHEVRFPRLHAKRGPAPDGDGSSFCSGCHTARFIWNCCFAGISCACACGQPPAQPVQRQPQPPGRPAGRQAWYRRSVGW